MNHGIISGDIIASTSLAMQEKEVLVQHVKKLFGELTKKYKVFGRVVKGDQIECYIPDVKQTLRIALILKCFIKSKTDMPFASTGSTHKLSAGNRHFKIHGIRLAIVIGQMNKVDRKKGILDGEAIYTAGRVIDEQHTSNKGRIVIKNSMIFISSNTEWQGEFEVALSLIDILIAKCTAKQSAVLVERLYGKTEEEMSALFNISQSAVNQTSNAAGWQGIEKAINRFEKIVHA